MMRFKSSAAIAMVAVLAAGSQSPALSAESIPVGVLADNSGATAEVASVYARGVIDAMQYINQHGGANGKTFDYDVVDYAYDGDRAVATYKDWVAKRKPVVIQGWGTPDTESLVDLAAKDQIVFMSGSSSGHVTDPTGRSTWAKTAAPYNFFYGPSYSDGCRGLVQWAAEEWRKSVPADQSVFLKDLHRPKFVHMGDNAAYPEAPREACASYARDLGFEVLPAIRYSLRPGDFTAQCNALRQSGANYAFLGNTSESNIALVKACTAAGVNVQMMTNIYGWDERAAKQAAEDGNGMAFVVTAGTWTDHTPGMTLVHDISKLSDPTGKVARLPHYMRGVCSAFLMRDAVVGADKMGAVTGANVKKAFEQMTDHVPAGLEGVCLPSTWRGDDHRGTGKVTIYRSSFEYGHVNLTKAGEVSIPLRPDWLGW